MPRHTLRRGGDAWLGTRVGALRRGDSASRRPPPSEREIHKEGGADGRHAPISEVVTAEASSTSISSSSSTSSSPSPSSPSPSPPAPSIFTRPTSAAAASLRLAVSCLTSTSFAFSPPTSWRLAWRSTAFSSMMGFRLAISHDFHLPVGRRTGSQSGIDAASCPCPIRCSHSLRTGTRSLRRRGAFRLRRPVRPR